MQSRSDQDAIGVVVIGRNEGERLRLCLESVVGAGRAVVYVDSGSTDASTDLARSLGAEVVDLDMSRPFSASRGRNAGLERLLAIAPGTTLVQFVDGDCRVHPAWLQTAGDALAAEPQAAVVCGRLREAHPDASLYNRLCDIEWDAPPGVARSCGGNAMYRVSAFKGVGGFNEDVVAGEEPELCYRLRHAAHTIRRLPDDMALHDADMHRFSQWWRRAARGGWAMAHGAALHGRGAERFNVRRILSVLFWTLALPAAAILWPGACAAFVPLLLPGAAWAWCTLLSLLVPALYLALVLRIALAHRARGRSVRDSALVAWFTLLAKFAELTGIVRFWLHARAPAGPARRAFDKPPAPPATAPRGPDARPAPGRQSAVPTSPAGANHP